MIVLKANGEKFGHRAALNDLSAVLDARRSFQVSQIGLEDIFSDTGFFEEQLLCYNDVVAESFRRMYALKPMSWFKDE